MSIAHLSDQQGSLVNAVVVPVSHCGTDLRIVNTTLNKDGTELMIVLSCPGCKHEYYISAFFRPMGKPRGQREIKSVA